MSFECSEGAGLNFLLMMVRIARRRPFRFFTVQVGFRFYPEAVM